MSTQPANVWRRLSPQLQAQIQADLTTIIQEVIDIMRNNLLSCSQPTFAATNAKIV